MSPFEVYGRPPTYVMDRKADVAELSNVSHPNLKTMTSIASCNLNNQNGAAARLSDMERLARLSPNSVWSKRMNYEVRLLPMTHSIINVSEVNCSSQKEQEDRVCEGSIQEIHIGLDKKDSKTSCSTHSSRLRSSETRKSAKTIFFPQQESGMHPKKGVKSQKGGKTPTRSSKKRKRKKSGRKSKEAGASCSGCQTSEKMTNEGKLTSRSKILKCSNIGSLVKTQTVYNQPRSSPKKSKVRPFFPVVIPLERHDLTRKSGLNEEKPHETEKDLDVKRDSTTVSPRKIYFSEKQSGKHMGIPSVPPCSPSADYSNKRLVVQSLNDIKSQRLLKSTLAKLEVKQNSKLTKQKEALEERANQLEKSKQEEEKRKRMEQQRAEIYALNKILSAFEKEKFEKFKLEKSAVPI